MKITVFTNLAMKKNLQKVHYEVDGNKSIEFDGEVCFPINGVLAKKLTKEDDVKVVVFAKEDKDGNTEENERIFKDELNALNESIGAKIEYKVIRTPFVETQDIHYDMMLKGIDELTKDCRIYADITYGPKTLPFIIFYVLKFAEKYYNANIENIIYGKIDFRNDNKIEDFKIFDITPLYYLNGLMDSFDNIEGDKARELLEKFFKI